MDEWQHLADLVRRERTARRQTQAEFARLLGLGVRTVRHLESGRPHRYAPETIYAVEDALPWEGGSFDLIVGGADPRVVPDPDFDHVREAWPKLSPERRAAILDIVDGQRR